MGSGRASATLALPTPISTAQETTARGLRAAVGDHIEESAGDWGRAWAVGNQLLDPSVAGSDRDQTLADALEPWVGQDGWGSSPGSVAFWDDPDPVIGFGEDAGGVVDLPSGADQWGDRVDALLETLLEDLGATADFWDVAAAAERRTDDTSLIAEVLTRWDEQPGASVPTDDLFVGPDENFEYETYYDRTTGFD